MKKVSGSTFYYKKLFPALWFGILGLMLVSSLAFITEETSLLPLAMPILMAVLVISYSRRWSGIWRMRYLIMEARWSFT